MGGSLGGLRGNEPARAEEALGEVGLSRYARWGWVIASKARFGSLPLLPRLGGGRDRLLGMGGSLGGLWGQATVGIWRIEMSRRASDDGCVGG
jgi:hypothetical protein